MKVPPRLRTLLAVLFVAAALAVLALPGTFLDRGQEWMPGLPAMKADMTLEGIRYRRDEDGRLRVRVLAESGARFRAARLLRLEAVKADFFPDAGGRVHLRAREGEFQEAEGLLTLQGDVVLRTADGKVLETERLFLDQKARRIWSTEPVRMAGAGIEIRGEGFEFLPDEGRLRVFHQTTLLRPGAAPAP
ncbi:LPS export ABC transporter periplasmic protein LptC [Dissulfurirhabdus thermomarina]|uniref:LPS export ABC transporter periplasmic protein LptC n=1 Tax=Dissulfurirhabdus thermomarina TaxID=1765737 RepID=A0A6N9TTA8_DISTH|nr:LPS export ABC transporter periplasmic protein LptC [Dissulfurirhabdus thermomarina]NDY41726.1 LPS export ABC transporter periplasmic protein LptC [Dissulfurirhabdus thermomarina]NMX23662.1 LPS export ABC transporter periplasmic protein LptC [Dissulfurirhabdus thermomarina]